MICFGSLISTACTTTNRSLGSKSSTAVQEERLIRRTMFAIIDQGFLFITEESIIASSPDALEAVAQTEGEGMDADRFKQLIKVVSIAQFHRKMIGQINHQTNLSSNEPSTVRTIGLVKGIYYKRWSLDSGLCYFVVSIVAPVDSGIRRDCNVLAQLDSIGQPKRKIDIARSL